jgi:gliding motility-associated-like protein
MKTFYTLVLMLSACLCLNISPSYGNHILGSELRYQFVSANGNQQTYKLTFVFFADCGEASVGSYNTLTLPANPRVQIKIYKNGVVQSLGPAPGGGIYLDPVATGYQQEITPVCPDEADNTKCSVPKGDYPGVMKFTFEGLVTLPDTSANWRFNFEGQHTSNAAGRSGLINNLVGAGTMCIYAILNNTIPIIPKPTGFYTDGNGNYVPVFPPYDPTGKNNSPTFTSEPTPFFCINQPTTFNLAAIDQEGDSLAFSLIPALNLPVAGNGTYANCNYVNPLSGATPIASAPGSFSFSSLTGQTSFTPDAMVNACVVQQVSEYRSGILVGTSMREMTFIMLDNCPNDGPDGPVTNINNGNVDPAEPTRINVCQGIEGSVAFDLHGNDPDGDNIDIFATSLPPGAVAPVTNNGTPSPVLHFSWDPGGFPPGDYVFFVTLRDDGCPVRVTQTIAYTITIHESYISGTTDTIEICNGETYSFFGKYYYSTGLYDTTFATVKGCDSTLVLNLKVNPLPNMLLNTGNAAGVCPGSSTTLSLAQPEASTTFQWLRDNQPVSGETGPSYKVSEAGMYEVAARTDEGCVDTSRKVKVDVYPLPDASIESVSENNICAGDTVTLIAAEGERYIYQWSPEKFFRLFSGSDGKEVKGIIEYTTQVGLTVFNKWGCQSSDSILVATRPCCEVFVPDAFSPNSDGNNDYFQPALQPGQIIVTMQVFNRWGKLVYNNKDIKKGWNGKYESGDEAMLDTYMYLVRYTCSDGHNYEKKGDIVLIR